jgi:hypothetical protein
MHFSNLLVIKEKKGKREEAIKGIFWRITAIDGENRLCLGCAIAKTEAEAVYAVMDQIKKYIPQEPLAMAKNG